MPKVLILHPHRLLYNEKHPKKRGVIKHFLLPLLCSLQTSKFNLPPPLPFSSSSPLLPAGFTHFFDASICFWISNVCFSFVSPRHDVLTSAVRSRQQLIPSTCRYTMCPGCRICPGSYGDTVRTNYITVKQMVRLIQTRSQQNR